MKATRDNLHVTIVDATDGERTWARLTLRYETRGGRFGGAAVVRVMDDYNDRFPAGLLPDLQRAAKADGVEVLLRDLRGPALAPVACDLSGWLDTEQLQAIAAALAHERGILQLPTGAGKTELFLALAGRIFPAARVLFLAPRAQLAVQALERWKLRAEQGHVPNEELGLLAEGEKRVRRVTLGTFQTLHAALAAEHPGAKRLLEATDLLVADECHTAAADTFYPVLMATTNARVRLGLSASPLQRGDERSVLTVGALGPVIHEVKASALVKSGRIVRPTITMYPCKQWAVRSHPRDTSPGRACPHCPAIKDEPCTDDCATNDPGHGFFQRIYRELVVESEARNELLVELVRACPKPALLFVRDLRHGKALTSLCARVTKGVRFVDGSKATHQRTQAVKELRRGDVDLIVCTSIFEAGVDIPELRSVGNAGAGLSTIRTVQMLGRVLRACEGKDSAVMFDVLDEGEPSLARHARRRRSAYRAEGFEVTEGAPPSTPRAAP